MDLNKSLRLAIDTGKVSVGANESGKAITSGSAKLVILSKARESQSYPEKKVSDEPALFWMMSEIDVKKSS